VFDDSFEHEAKYEEEGTENDDCVRVVLIADIWHPDLSNEEVRIFSFIANAQMKALKKLSDQATATADAADQASDDFYSVITNARKQLTVPESHIWGYDVRDD
jgi:hypothetical protein